MSSHVHALISPEVIANRDDYATAFANAQPFRHVVIDGFFRDDYAQRLLEQFPPFERGNARTENGTEGNKSTVERIRDLGDAFVALDDAIQSPEILALIGTVTGIPDLLYDPYYFGGGTHENRQGQDLDTHIDFNRHPIEGWHRRLNLIVYLNPEWDDAWGGSLELHSNPRASDDRITLITPSFNRAVIFETTESSWHGFSRIDLPAHAAGITRKSVALYFYTRERPAEELAATHSTIYIERPLPPRYQAGLTLSQTDVDELRSLFARHDQHHQRLYGEVTRLTTELEQAREALYAGRLGRLRRFLENVRKRSEK